MPYLIEGRANTVIKHKARVSWVPVPPKISKYGRIMQYPRR